MSDTKPTLQVGNQHYLYVSALGGARCGKCGEYRWPCSAEQARLSALPKEEK